MKSKLYPETWKLNKKWHEIFWQVYSIKMVIKWEDDICWLLASMNSLLARLVSRNASYDIQFTFLATQTGVVQNEG